MITEARAKQFQLLYKQETNEHISLEEAFRYAESLIEIVRLVYKPIKKTDFEKLDKH